jgi:single-stranded DNA-binding protein
LIFAIPGLVDRVSSVAKGDVIYVEGSINTNEWTTKEGEKKQIKEISCTTFKTVSKAANKTENKEYNQPKTTVSQSMAPKSDDDDIPF